MKIKFLSVIVSFLLVSFAITSCLDSDEIFQDYSTDATIHAFGLDAVLGKHYRFTIDQLRGEIYNLDSLPVGSDTIIDRILIDTLSTASGYVVLLNKAGTDSIKDDVTQGVNQIDSLDLRQGLTLKVLAPEALNMMYQGMPEAQYKQYIKKYSVDVRVHQQDPDSLDWGKNPIAQPFSTLTGKQKSVILNNRIYVYAENASVYSASISAGGNWSKESATGLPTTKLTSLINFKNVLYATTNDSKVYSSTNGINWSESSLLSGNIVTLIAPIGNTITAIKRVGPSDMKFCTTDGTTWKEGNTVPANFPYDNISATSYKNNIGIENVVIVGNTVGVIENDTSTVAWGYMEGQDWAAFITDSKLDCPKLVDPSIIRYNHAFYAFGKDFKTFYTSINGLAWQEVKKKFLFPQSIRGVESDYSMVVDELNFIWIMRSTPNEVWRGRLNKLGFKNAINQ